MVTGVVVRFGAETYTRQDRTYTGFTVDILVEMRSFGEREFVV